MGSTQHFQPCQIVCLEFEHASLYSEVIQIVQTRQVCWVRPLMLRSEITCTHSSTPLSEQTLLYDLRSASDLVCPVEWFRPALDTEVIPLLVELETSATQPQLEDTSTPTQKLNWFISQFCQHPNRHRII